MGELAAAPIVLLIGALFIAIVVYHFRAIARRREELGAWASAHGLSFDPSRDKRMDDRFREFDCLRIGHTRYAYNAAQGVWSGLPILAFDYHYTTGSGKRRTDHHFSAVLVESPLPLKPLTIRREGFADRVLQFFGLDDINFESAEFSRTFHVQSRDKRWAYAVIHQKTMDYLLRAPEYNIQFDNTHIMLWRMCRLSPSDLDTALDMAQTILGLFPDYLVRELKGRDTALR